MRIVLVILVSIVTTLLSPKPAHADNITLSLRETFCTLIYLDHYLGVERFVIRYDPSLCPPPTEFAQLRSTGARAITFDAMSCFADNLQQAVLADDELMGFVQENCNLSLKPILLGEISFAESLQLASTICHQTLTAETDDGAITLMVEDDPSLTVSTQCIQ